MREDFLFFSMVRNRTRLLKLAESCPADKRTEIPAGFRNNILWHLGHILTVGDSIVYGFSEGGGRKLPASYPSFFGNGSKPSDWNDETPSWETVVSLLQEQMAQIRADFAGKLDRPVKEGFTKAETVEELLSFMLVHESSHVGNINTMLKLLV